MALLKYTGPKPRKTVARNGNVYVFEPNCLVENPKDVAFLISTGAFADVNAVAPVKQPAPKPEPVIVIPPAPVPVPDLPPAPPKKKAAPKAVKKQFAFPCPKCSKGFNSKEALKSHAHFHKKK